MDKFELRDWCVENEIHPSIFGFLSAHLSLHESGFIYGDGNRWKSVSDILNDETLSDTDRHQAIERVIGSVGATHFSKYVVLLQRIEDIFAEKSTVDEKMSVQYGVDMVNIISNEMIERLRKITKEWGSDYQDSDAYQTWMADMDWVFAYVEKNFSTELTVVYLRRFTDNTISRDVISTVWQRPPYQWALAAFGDML